MSSKGNIAVIGWGSLIWDPGQYPLPIVGDWESDGPMLPVEFVRKSDDGRLTLVLWNKVPPVQTLWALMDVPDVGSAAEALQKRERTALTRIGRWPPSHPDSYAQIIERWAGTKALAGVVWTALPARWKNKDGEDKDGLAPCLEDALTYLRELTGEERAEAEKYVRCAPASTDTPFRREFRNRLGWAQWQDCSQSVIPAKAGIPLP